MVHVSLVPGTPLGLRDATVISQITSRWRDGGPTGPRGLFTKLRLLSHNVAITKSRQDYADSANAIYTPLSLSGAKFPQEKPS